MDQELMRAVTAATVELCCGDDYLKPRLISVARILNTVLDRRENWPANLLGRAQEIADELRKEGNEEQTISGMSSQSARRLAERILHLYSDCQASWSSGEDR